MMTRPAPSAEEWAEATRQAAATLPTEARAHGDDIRSLLAMTLGEGRFGPRHWEPSAAQRMYYAVKPAVPRRLSHALRRADRAPPAPSPPPPWPLQPPHVPLP